MNRVVEKFNEIGEDFRVFGPMLQDHAKFRSDMDHLSRDFRELRGTLGQAIGEFRGGLDELEARLDKEARERAAVREAREQKERERERQDRQEHEERQKADRRDRWARWAIAASLLLTFVSMTVGWVLLATGSG